VRRIEMRQSNLLKVVRELIAKGMYRLREPSAMIGPQERGVMYTIRPAP